MKPDAKAILAQLVTICAGLGHRRGSRQMPPPLPGGVLVHWSFKFFIPVSCHDPKVQEYRLKAQS